MKFASQSTCSSMRTQNQDQSVACLARRRRKGRQKIARSERDRGRRCGRDLTSIPLVETGPANKTARRRTTDSGIWFSGRRLWRFVRRLRMPGYRSGCANDPRTALERRRSGAASCASSHLCTAAFRAGRDTHPAIPDLYATRDSHTYAAQEATYVRRSGSLVSHTSFPHRH